MGISMLHRMRLVIVSMLCLVLAAGLTGATTATGAVVSAANYRGSFYPSISEDGMHIAFACFSNPTGSPSNEGNVIEIYVRDLATSTTRLVSNLGPAGSSPDVLARTSVSADGRYVAFTTGLPDVVPNDTNNANDLFVKDMATGIITCVSTDSSGALGNHGSAYPMITPDGRYVSFASSASNLVPGDTNGAEDIFLKDTLTGTTRRVSTDSSGAQGNRNSALPAPVSSNGRYVTFTSYADNLVPEDEQDTRPDVFMKDTLTGTTSLVSTTQSGAGGTNSFYPAMSADGRYVAFNSYESLLPGDNNVTPDDYIKDTLTGITTLASADSSGVTGANYADPNPPAISGDGRYAVFTSNASSVIAGDTNGTTDLFMKDSVTGATTRISTDSGGAQANGPSLAGYAVSGDARYVAFTADATNLAPGDTHATSNVFVKDRATGETRLVSAVPLGSAGDLFRASTDSSGAQSNLWSCYPSISADARYVAFCSGATNLVPGDTNATADIFREGHSDRGDPPCLG